MKKKDLLTQIIAGVSIGVVFTAGYVVLGKYLMDREEKLSSIPPIERVEILDGSGYCVLETNPNNTVVFCHNRTGYDAIIVDNETGSDRMYIDGDIFGPLDEKVDIINETGKVLLVRENDYETHQQDFDDADLFFQRIKERFRDYID